MNSVVRGKKRDKILSGSHYLELKDVGNSNHLINWIRQFSLTRFANSSHTNQGFRSLFLSLKQFRFFGPVGSEQWGPERIQIWRNTHGMTKVNQDGKRKTYFKSLSFWFYCYVRFYVRFFHMLLITLRLSLFIPPFPVNLFISIKKIKTKK